ncbi:7702_t:CDS:2, partial [Dentiscutata heterogama]
TLILSDDKNEYDDELVINFEQNLYKQALNLAKYEDDSWKELDVEDMTILQEISYKEAGINNRMPKEFAMNEINAALKGIVEGECKVLQLNIIILKAGPEPNSNHAVH